MSTLEADIHAALATDNAEQLRAIASSVNWSTQDATLANRILQRIALYGCSGRTQRYRDVVDQVLTAGVVPNLSTCALLQANDLAERILADTPAAVRETDENGATPLHHAAERGNAALAARLCAQGAPLDAVDARGETPLAKALHAGPWKNEPATAVVRILREHGTRVELFDLAAMGDAAGLALALRGGATANDADDLGRTALFMAARNNHLDVVRVLLANSADPNRAAHDGQTPLSQACLHTLSQECDLEIVRALVGHGAPMTLEAAIVLEDLQAIRDAVASDAALLDGQDHESALGYAIHAWHPASLRCLIQLGAQPNAKNWQHIERIAGADTTLVAELSQLAKSTEQHLMTLEIEVVEVEERTIAAVRAHIAMSDIPDKIFPLMDRVWSFIRGNGIEGFGHNIWLYGTPSDGEVDIEIGVQVPGAFEATGDIVRSSTPAGKAARAVHFGDYSELPRVNMALVSWCQEHGHALAGRCWEIYGDWEEDPAKRRTDVYHLIA